MTEPSSRAIYSLKGWEIDLTRRELRSRGVSIPIGSRAFEILEVLVLAGGELVNKHHLLDRVWPGAVVEENTVHFHVSAIRKAFGADRDLVNTISGRGYRLLGTWTVLQAIELEPRVHLEKIQRPFRTNVPVAASALIGRGAQKQHLLNVLSAYRVVTLTGPGGIGKSVLALEIARSLFPKLGGDCWLVELASLSDPALVPSAVASVLGLRLGGNEISAESLARAIGGDKILLVLDNCEHLADAAAGFAEAIVRLCPNASVLATSREILRIEGEYVCRVPALEVPPQRRDEAADINGYSAVQLFTARLMALESGFSARPADLPLIASICQHLDGIPLAIEFAAARGATLGLQQVADRLSDRFNLLTAGRRTALLRHQTLRATLDWSYGLLREQERALLRRLAIFVGGFTLEAATAVAGGAGVTASVVAEGIAGLVAKSLVSLDASVPSGRWRLLETIRAYALDKLAESGDAKDAARGHAEFFRDLFASAVADPLITLAEAHDDPPRYVREIDNLRAALDWAFSPHGDPVLGVELTVAAVPLWFQLSLIDECRAGVERALAVLDAEKHDDRREMQLYAALGWSKMYSPGPMRDTGAAWATTLELADALGDTDYRLRATWGLWAGTQDNGECRAALALAEKFRELAAGSPNPFDRLVSDRMMGLALHFLGRQADARRLIERMLASYVSPNRSSDIVRFKFDQQVMARNTFARILWLQGFPDRAMRELESNLEYARSINHVHSLCNVMTQAAVQIALLAGDLATAERLDATLLHLIERHGLNYWRAHYDSFNGQLLIKRGDLDAGLRSCRAGVDALRKSRSFQHLTAFLAALAEGSAKAGQVGDGLAAIDEALARCERHDERWCIAELLRIKGKLVLLDSAPDAAREAESHFLRSLDWARQQGALSWELRTATSLSRLWRDGGRTAQAREILSEVHGRFTEGFTTSDLAEAAHLLDELR